MDNLAEGFVEADRVIREMPTVDAEVVVRCKDCKHYDMGVCLKIYSDGNAHPEAWQSRSRRTSAPTVRERTEVMTPPGFAWAFYEANKYFF